MVEFNPEPDDVHITLQGLSRWQKHGEDRVYVSLDGGEGYVDVTTATAHDLFFPSSIQNLYPKNGKLDTNADGDYILRCGDEGEGVALIISAGIVD